MKLAIVGATGLVGSVMLKVLAERKIRPEELYLVGSERSAGKEITYEGKNYKVITPDEALQKKPDVALFSAGSGVSKQYARAFTDQGTYVIDNSSAWRMEEGIPLVIPEINGDILNGKAPLIANPNCSTIQLLMGVYPLQQAFGIERMIVSTYQSVTGSGIEAVNQLDAERKGESAEKAYPYPIDLNCLPHCDNFQENGYTKEEMKLVNESQKILDDEDLGISPTAVRVPVKGGHSESVSLTLKKPFNLDEIRQAISGMPGVTLQDTPKDLNYPMPLYAEGKDEVYVGRLRKDESAHNSLNLWIVSDNLRKGAATNTVQIMETLMEKKLV